MLFSVSSSTTRCLVTLSCVVTSLLQPHALLGVQAADGAMAAAQAVDDPTAVAVAVAASTTPALDCATGTADIYSADTLSTALYEAIEGMIALQHPLSCTTGYV